MAFHLLTAGVAAETALWVAALTVMVMGRIGAEKLLSAFLVGVLGVATYLVVHFVAGPILFDLTYSQIKLVVLFAGAAAGVGLVGSVVFFRPKKRPGVSRGIVDDQSGEEPEIEL